MFAIGHAATALLIKRAYPETPIAPILVSVQAMEFAWVALNWLGVERTTTGSVVRSVADVQLAYMPWSHSLATPLLAALMVWLVLEYGLGKPQWGRALGLGVLSHLALDLLMHGRDIALAPGLSGIKLGLGIYWEAPLAAFLIEMAYGIACWAVFGGRASLILVIVLANLLNLPLLSPQVGWPIDFLAGKPTLIVSVIFIQIVATLALVGFFSGPRSGHLDSDGVARQTRRAARSTEGHPDP